MKPTELFRVIFVAIPPPGAPSALPTNQAWAAARALMSRREPDRELERFQLVYVSLRTAPVTASTSAAIDALQALLVLAVGPERQPALFAEWDTALASSES